MKTTWIEASAGAGKTTQLTRIIEENKAKNAIFITFSNAAANELNERIKDKSNIQIFTAHSLAYKTILQKYPEKKLIEHNIREKIISQMLENQEFKKLLLWLSANNLKQANSLTYKQNDISNIPQKIEPYANGEIFESLANNKIIEKLELKKIKKIAQTWESKVERGWLKQRIKEHEEYLQQYTRNLQCTIDNLIDIQEKEYKKLHNLLYYDDLILLATEIFTEDTKLLDNVEMILIDESQDLSNRQWKMLYTLIKNINCDLIVAGDPKQLIYDFQDAKTEYYEQYKTKFRTISEQFELQTFATTYRLPVTICDNLNKIFANCKAFEYPHHTPAIEEIGKFEVIKINEYTEIIALINEINAPMQQIMILYKQQTEQLRIFAHTLHAAGFALNSPFATSHPVIKDFKHLLQYIKNSDPFSRKIVSMTGIQQQQLDQIIDCFYKTFDLHEIFLLWQKSINIFLESKLQDSTQFWLEILRRYALFYRYDLLAAIDDSSDFYKNNHELFSTGIFFNSIHSSKGKEADYVILLDTDRKSKFKNDTEMLLYVAMTRARKALYIPIFKVEPETWSEKITAAISA